ncbi:GNAT family N-acetyltransferase [Paraburkholderia sp. 40]|uniref:GNAT family N-acetyltransferase n=1 Tax=Paraburkholderia sp. 40 TaxID=2991059 RepID=UPI003D1D962E
MTTSTSIRTASVTLAEVLLLRERVLHADSPAGRSELRSDRKADTLHLGAFLGNELIGVSTIARANPVPELTWRLCEMAIRAGWRGHGIGTALAEKCIDHAKLAAGRMVWCSARESAFGFYRSIGFERVGELFSRADTIDERYGRRVPYLPN